MTGRGIQLPLDLSLRPALDREEFLIGQCNEEAVAWIDRYPDWPSSIAVLLGPPGSGKTHLLSVWAKAANALVLDAGALEVAGLDALISDASVVCVDRADAPKEPDSLFHLFNMVREREGHLLVASRTAPAQWHFATADLRSRLSSVVTLHLADPDDAMLEAMLIKQMADKGLSVSPELLRYLLARIPRTFDAVNRVSSDLDMLCLAQKKRPTIALAKQVVAGLDD